MLSDAPRPGSVVSAANRRPAYDPARPTSSAIDASSRMHRGQPGGVELRRSVPRRSADRRVRPARRSVEQLVDARRALAVDEGLEVPRDVGGGEVVSGMRAFAVVEVMPPSYGREPHASGSGSEWTTVRRLVARVIVT